MQTTKFEGFSMQDTVKQVKKELGKDAVILSTREKLTPQSEGKPAVKTFEIVASPGVSSLTASQEKFDFIHKDRTARGEKIGSVISRDSTLSINRPNFPIVQKQEGNIQIVKGSSVMQAREKVQRGSEVVQNQPTPLVPTLSNAVFRGGNPLSNNKSEAVSPSQMRSSSAMLSDKGNNFVSEFDKIKKDLEDIPLAGLSDQMRELKFLMHNIIREKSQSNGENFNPYISDIGIKLRTCGVLESIILEVQQHLMTSKSLSDLFRADDTSGTLRDQYLAQAIRHIYQLIKIQPESENYNDAKFVCLVGPTGVGKTTTIAKLASVSKIRKSKSVALVTMDSYRVAATEQLRIYSRILDCPFFEVQDTKELETLANKLHKYDLVYLDTAGRSSKYGEHMESLKSLLNIDVPIDFHLALSASMKQRDLEENLNSFRFIRPQSLIFTKLDESWSYGEILNLAIISKIPISYFSTGQRVPEDLEKATKERIVERIFNL